MQEGFKQSPLCTELLHYVRYTNSLVYSPDGTRHVSA